MIWYYPKAERDLSVEKMGITDEGHTAIYKGWRNGIYSEKHSF